MPTIYSVIKEPRAGVEEGIVIASYDTTEEAEKSAEEARLSDPTNSYLYFVQAVRCDKEISNTRKC